MRYPTVIAAVTCLLTATIEGVDTDVNVSFSVEEKEIHEGGCSASATGSGAPTSFSALAALLLAGLRRRRRSR